MADTVDSQVVWNGNDYVVKLIGVSDGTGETNVVKVDKSALLAPDGEEPNRLIFKEVQWTIQGFSSVRLNWDHTTDDEGLVLSGNGFMDFSLFGGIPDPASSGGTGDLLLTSAGPVSGATYCIILVLAKGN